MLAPVENRTCYRNSGLAFGEEKVGNFALIWRPEQSNTKIARNDF
jgi:hypothetical protein